MAGVRLPVLKAPAAARSTGSIQGDGLRPRIVPADVRGRFDRARKVVFAALIASWAALPWIKVGGAPSVFLDIDARRFFLFGLTFNAQDSWLLFFLLSGVGFGLVYATALAGRAWCGWACPQTVFLEGVYRRIERLIEGPRERHLRRDAGPPSLERVARKVLKHAAFVAVSMAVAHIVLAYFVSLPRAFAMVRGSPGAHPEAFAWVLGITALFYGNFAWFREQFCVVMCPYGRMQSVLLDDDSLVVGYDVARGEPRGKKGKATGDCVDCNRCVVVCPTAIDIRDGLQLDCLACTACIDACDEVMDKLGRPRGLIRYDSTNGLAGRPKKVVRPRLVLYTAMLLLGGAVALLATRTRTDFEVLASRLTGAPYTVEQGDVRNAFDLHVVNKRGAAARFDIAVVGPPGMRTVLPMARVEVAPLGDAHVPLFLSLAQSEFHGDAPVRIQVVRADSGGKDTMDVNVSFLGALK
ncbi:MAG TPA: cytochrome c oxidase accessory protein CcoG [Polyangiaceae bacterium]|jgi:cytochrome c oxidase accessory protein FixG